MKRVLKLLKKVWALTRQLLSVRSLLDVLGLKQTVVALLAFFGAATLALGKSLSLPVIVVGSAFIFAIVLFIVNLIVIARNQRLAGSAVQLIHGGPEIVIEYSYEESKQWEALNGRNTNASAPLLLKNVSTDSTAYNVEVLPLTVEGENAMFEPSLISHIEPLKSREIKARIPNIGTLQQHSLPTFLMRSYKDTSTEELMGIKSFWLEIHYENGNVPPLRYKAECEILFKPWHQVTDIGTIRRSLR